ncbi:GPI mannosyltransferase 1 [Trypanosoma melophagium]|uniref:GPI mannosyltransferase 1 n=1 Tax=Trypanosoma melophagium TaxID=715481 RepID=UPI00351A1518|nr:GPI mannosyltransferase 1 [Trypanosoma melophagium]
MNQQRSNMTRMDRLTIGRLIWWGALLRLILIIYAFFHDRWFRVKYTDIDYMIIVDGAREMWMGGSPFDRTTFRYTPLLAVLMLPSVLLANPIGKLIFALCDLGAAYYCYEVLLTFATERSAKWMVSLFILFNPIVLNVSTRGNSDMLMTFMSLMVLAKFAQSKYYQAAAVLGFAIHFKIYPIIYALPLVLGVWEQTEAKGILQRILRVVPLVTLCGIIAVISFLIPTFICYKCFGQQYLDEAFIYHVYREDHRHNFSPCWLLMYLNMARRSLGIEGVDYAPGLLAFLPQIIVLFLVSYKLRFNIAHAFCIQTVLFVAFNKVCTVQYFVWFLPFLTFLFCEPRGVNNNNNNDNNNKKDENSKKYKLNWQRPGIVKTVLVVTLWAATIPLWVSTAVPLEFHGKSDFGRVWIVSCVFFIALVSLAAWLARVARHIQETTQSEKKVKHA